jgi:hypothetical protein
LKRTSIRFDHSARVPRAAERTGDFSGLGTPLINFAAGGKVFPDGQIPPGAINTVSLTVLNLYPQGNVSPTLIAPPVVGKNDYDQAGGRLDFNVSSKDQLFARFSYSGGYDFNPVSVPPAFRAFPRGMT